MRKAMLLFFFLFAGLSAQPKNFFDKQAWPGYSSIDPNDLRAHLTFLASDELEGRETTFRGQKVAAQYIAAWFSRLRLKPGGTNGTYFQPFELDNDRVDPSTSISIKNNRGTRSFVFGKDFLSNATLDTTFSSVPVFVGFFDSPRTPEEETALADKIVVLLAGQRDTSEAGRQRGRRSMFRAFRNAAAVLVVINEKEGTIDDLAKSFAGFLQKGSFSLRESARRGGSTPTVFISPTVAEELLAGLNSTLSRLRENLMSDSTFHPIPLKNVTVTLDFNVHHEVKTSENVIGILEGSDPVLKNEYVVLTAHYDHVGVNPASGDVYNGADDDGSGTSMILELAEAFAMNPRKPKRTIVFMTVAGEEKGLLGSSYYTSHPIVPLENTLANINMDMIGRIDPKHRSQNEPYVYIIGSDKISTELDSLLQAANRQTVNLALDYQYNDDNDPNQFYRRSDHYNFARNGVPIAFFFTGVHEDYHRPTDTVDKIEFDRMAMIGKLMYATTWKAAEFPRMLRKDGKPSVYSGGQ
ncbi:MAG: hypothetical protein HBSIN02_00480 [Bacteroidia bacterium]|nr:MAG: hypothetical protein HBSIN02_00480 [Bacteroidia bacterium]